MKVLQGRQNTSTELTMEPERASSNKNSDTTSSLMSLLMRLLTEQQEVKMSKHIFCLIAICHSKEATKESSRGSLASVQQNKSAEYQLEKGGFWRRLFLWLKNLFAPLLAIFQKKNELKSQDIAENAAFLKMEQGEEATGDKMDASESPGEDAAEETLFDRPSLPPTGVKDVDLGVLITSQPTKKIAPSATSKVSEHHAKSTKEEQPTSQQESPALSTSEADATALKQTAAPPLNAEVTFPLPEPVQAQQPTFPPVDLGLTITSKHTLEADASLQQTTAPPKHPGLTLPPKETVQTSWPPPTHQASILSNKRVIFRLTITPTHKMAAPMWSKILPPCGHKMATTRWPSGEGSWEGPGLQRREVGGKQAGMCPGSFIVPQYFGLLIVPQYPGSLSLPHLPWFLNVPRTYACHVRAAHVGPMVSVPVAAVVAAGPGSSDSGVGYRLYPDDLHSPGALQALQSPGNIELPLLNQAVLTESPAPNPQEALAQLPPQQEASTHSAVFSELKFLFNHH
ncbi:hypothetical protein QTO34_009260 [Cnephaeus nilssonii]|uniref:Uncharacterized protein n=1 Tax=Cnephaeus nilssonii TaxID=3371016 RepID=A0AA40HHH8_CNENI|nr:hypothetical protein QTO34_009260 [Eptesicus nilssonii]